jgi:hypothetical protein
MVCCKSSCDAKRAQRNPYKLLFNKGTKVLKVCCTSRQQPQQKQLQLWRPYSCVTLRPRSASATDGTEGQRQQRPEQVLVQRCAAEPGLLQSPEAEQQLRNSTCGHCNMDPVLAQPVACGVQTNSPHRQPPFASVVKKLASGIVGHQRSTLLAAVLRLQGFMCLFGLVAIAFAIYGMASVKKDVTDDAFGVVTTIANYTTGVTDTVDRLMDTIGGVSGIIDDFQDIIVNDLDIDGIMTNLMVRLHDAATAPVLQYCCGEVLRHSTDAATASKPILLTAVQPATLGLHVLTLWDAVVCACMTYTWQAFT